MPLSLQEKLALMMTSAGSMRNLGALVGVSHQRIGRWLREGEPDGVKQIPAAAAEAINTAFEIHRDVSAQQAMIDARPFNRYRPIYLERKRLRTGEIGDRVIGESTEFIRSKLRQQIMIDQQRTGRYISASVRSIINLKRYFTGRAEEELRSGRRKGYTRAELARAMLQSFVSKEKHEKNRIIDKTEPFPLYTRYESISPLKSKDDIRGVIGIEEQLREKHEPATGEHGTKVSDQFLFQLTPASYVAKQVAKKSASKSRSNRRHIKGRGNK